MTFSTGFQIIYLFTVFNIKPIIPFWVRNNALNEFQYMGNPSVTHVTFVQFFYFHWATIKHLDVQSNKFKAYDDLGVQLYITT